MYGRSSAILYEFYTERKRRQMCAVPGRYKAYAGDIGKDRSRRNGKVEDLDLLEELATTITDTALCGLERARRFRVMSTLKLFREEYMEPCGGEKMCFSYLYGDAQIYHQS